MSKPSNPQGTRDFGPAVMRKRNYILNTIKTVFQKYGFEPLETPAMEKLETLTGKYGDEGDKLLYKIRSNKSLQQEINEEVGKKVSDLLGDRWVPGDSKLGLRYDLTVPFARFVVQHRNDITFPFRRYQIQQVWRGDRPQKGRFREFTQCDADVIGSKSMVNEADLVLIYKEVFENLGLADAVLKINHRKFLEALVEELKLDFPVTKFTTSLDKLDKIGIEGVTKELVALGVNENQVSQLFAIINQAELTSENLNRFLSAFNNNDSAKQAYANLSQIVGLVEHSRGDLKIELDLSLARGLDYYTGCIFEALVPNSGIGSISGGGRYDDLTGVFGLKDVSGVGISFGIDRIYEILEERSLWPEDIQNNHCVLLCHFSEANQQFAMKMASTLRDKGVACIVYPDQKKIGKQFDFANKASMTHAIVIGDDEMESGQIALKNLTTGVQDKHSIEELVAILS
jgi:histidyl-tRNA synthetase